MTNLTINSNQYLSDISDAINIDTNSWIIAPTGSGKSYWVAKCLTNARIIAVPTTGLADEFHAKYGATKYYEGNKEITNANLIAVTYDSIGSLCNKIDISEYDLFVDEAHNFISAASKSFRWKSMIKLRDILPYAKSFHLVTATYVSINDPMFNELEVTSIQAEAKYNKEAQYVRYTDINSTVKSIVDYNYAQGNLTAVLLNDTNMHGALGRMTAAIGSGVVCINSKMKNTADYNKVVVDGIVDKSTRALISTTVLKEGNSITEHSENVTIVICGVFHPIEIEQFCARFRSASNITVAIMRKDNGSIAIEEDDNVDTEDMNDYEYHLYSQEREYFEMSKVKEATFDVATKLIRRTNTAILNMDDFSANYHITEYPSYAKVNERHFRLTDTGLQLDHLAIANDVYEQEKSFAYANDTYMIDYLNNYGWSFGSDCVLQVEMTEEEKSVVKDAIKAYSEDVKVLTEKFYNLISEDTVEGNLLTITRIGRGTTKDDLLEKAIREKVLYLNHFTNDCAKSIEMLKTIGAGKRAWTKFVKHASMKKAVLNAPTNDLAKVMLAIKRDFTEDCVYTGEEITTKINNIRHSVYIVSNDLSSTKCTQILNLVYNTSRSSITVDGDKVSGVKVKSEVFFMEDSNYDTRTEADKIMDMIESFDVDITFA